MSRPHTKKGKKTSNSKVLCPCCMKTVTRATKINHLKKKTGTPAVQVAAEAYRTQIHAATPRTNDTAVTARSPLQPTMPAIESTPNDVDDDIFMGDESEVTGGGEVEGSAVRATPQDPSRCDISEHEELNVSLFIPWVNWWAD